LRLYHCARQHPSSPQDVLVEELNYDVLDVGNVHLVHDAIYGLSQQLPHHPLVALAVGVLLQHLLLKGPQLVGRDIHSAGPSYAFLLVLCLQFLVVLLHEVVGLFSQRFDERALSTGWLVGCSFGSHL